jgi:hypothetical protein
MKSMCIVKTQYYNQYRIKYAYKVQIFNVQFESLL